MALPGAIGLALVAWLLAILALLYAWRLHSRLRASYRDCNDLQNYNNVLTDRLHNIRGSEDAHSIRQLGKQIDSWRPSDATW